ncbi:DNA helicase mcm9 [Rhizophlyctis rosea]|nr:DNA helicase mcm9 [Rhizophlyctis rosea]
MRTSGLAEYLTYKDLCHIRVDRLGVDYGIPEVWRNRLPRSADVGKLIVLHGTVIRSGMVKMVQTSKMYQCSACGGRFPVFYEREQYNLIPRPVRCKADIVVGVGGGCEGGKFREVPTDAGELRDVCKDYQEIKVQEQVAKLAMGTIPRSMVVILEDDLVDQCKAGDDVTITGVVTRRYKPFQQGERCDADIVLVANQIRINNELRANALLTDETRAEFEQFWEMHKNAPFTGRNIILRSFCPKIFGMYIVKLAVTLILIGGVGRTENGIKIRGDAHLLLVGDPGTGKSQFLRYASYVCPRTITTTGIGSTSAGLTVSAVKDSGEWHLEAGALVLADRGLCCIDEFGSIRESDKTAVHEAMEQQTISVAKAGLVCKLNTRCSILAATNPKGKYDPSQNVEVNIALASPLLSRFDLILVLLDGVNEEWDEVISSFILGTEATRNPHPIHSAQPSAALWPISKMQAYIMHVKAAFTPIMSKGAEDVLKKYYQMQRRADLRNAARTTVRLLESLVRLAQAHARLCFQSEVAVRDAVVAVILMEASMQSSALAGVTSTLHAAFPDDGEAEYLEQERKILGRLGLEHLVSAELYPPPPMGDGNEGGDDDGPSGHYMDPSFENIKFASASGAGNASVKGKSRAEHGNDDEQSDEEVFYSWTPSPVRFQEDSTPRDGGDMVEPAPSREKEGEESLNRMDGSREMPPYQSQAQRPVSAQAAANGSNSLTGRQLSKTASTPQPDTRSPTYPPARQTPQSLRPLAAHPSSSQPSRPSSQPQPSQAQTLTQQQPPKRQFKFSQRFGKQANQNTTLASQPSQSHAAASTAADGSQRPQGQKRQHDETTAGGEGLITSVSASQSSTHTERYLLSGHLASGNLVWDPSQRQASQVVRDDEGDESDFGIQGGLGDSAPDVVGEFGSGDGDVGGWKRRKI